MASPSAGLKPPAFPRARTHTLLQMEAVECGAAALGIILAHHGRIVPLEELRLACGVSRDGSKASNMLRAARSYGMEAKGYKKEPEELRAMKPPFIVFWNFNHFLVVEGFHQDRVFLNDPASGPRKVTWEEFDASFTGVVLEFSPGPGFTKGGEFPSLAKSLLARLKGSERALAFVVLVGLALVLPGLVIPAFTKIFVDEILIPDTYHWLKPLLLAMAITTVIQAALTWLQQAYLLRLETKLALASSGKFFWHVLRLPAEFFAQRFAGDISQRVSSNDRIASLLSGELATNAVNVVQIVFFGAVMAFYDPVLTLVGVLIVTLNVGALRWVSRKRKDGNLRLLQEQGKMMGTALGGLQMVESLKATGSESDFFSRWSGYLSKVVNTQQDLERYTQILNAVPAFLSSLSTAIILGFGGFRVMQGEMTMGMLVAFQGLMGNFTGPVNRLVSLGSSLQEIEGDMNRLDDVFKYPLDPCLQKGEEVPEEIQVSRLTGHVQLRSVTFGYSRLEAPLIENFDLDLRPGSRVALVGGSGSGKSTVAKLVCGLYAPWSGEILLDGKPREGVPRAILANSLALVDQEIFLFEGTIQDNLSLWNETLPAAHVVEAARDACILDDINLRARGFQSPVEEGGANFSGGQRQRLEIARALAQSPSIVVLDEATSALDAQTEKRIDEAIRRRGCTCLIVAHRLSTIRDADEIVVLDRGKVAQRGTHDSLKDQPGAYAGLISAE